MPTNHIFSHYDLTITTLTPLHVGSGNRLRGGQDFIIHDNRIWVANITQILRSLLPENQANRIATARTLAGISLNKMVENGWLKPEQLTPQSNLIKYVLAGEIPEDNEIHEFIKDVYNRPYLPGSGLKGAFRSILLRHKVEEDNRSLPEINMRDARFAAQVIEGNYDRPNRSKKTANFDLWRAFRIADSNPAPADSLALMRAFSISYLTSASGQRTGIPINFEGLPEGTTFQATLEIEDWLWRAYHWLRKDHTRNPDRNPYFSTDNYDQLTGKLVQIVNQHARQRLLEEKAYYNHFRAQTAGKGGFDVSNALRWIEKTVADLASLKTNEMILSAGRGTGWRSKTLGSVLQNPQKLSAYKFDEVKKRFKLGKGHWLRNPVIPLTRLVADCGGQRGVPPGWVKVVINPRP